MLLVNRERTEERERVIREKRGLVEREKDATVCFLRPASLCDFLRVCPGAETEE